MLSSLEKDYKSLLNRAERYIRNPNTSRASAVLNWRGDVMKWMRTHVSDSKLDIAFLTTPSPSDTGWSRGISARAVSGVQQGIKILQDAEQLLPISLKHHDKKISLDMLKRVFIVHGHDNLMKLSAARFVNKFGLEPIILHEQPNGGRTIIEKFLEHSDVGFALVLLSDDDKGGLKTEDSDTYESRARQNVIFELGFFIGKLGRSRVVALHKQGVEIPSDYSGVLFVPFDQGGIWEVMVAKEMRNVGLKIDMNKL